MLRSIHSFFFCMLLGESLSSPGGIDRARRVMGVCPQFDILWAELTAREHLLIYGSIKVTIMISHKRLITAEVFSHRAHKTFVSHRAHKTFAQQQDKLI